MEKSERTINPEKRRAVSPAETQKKMEPAGRKIAGKWSEAPASGKGIGKPAILDFIRRTIDAWIFKRSHPSNLFINNMPVKP